MMAFRLNRYLRSAKMAEVTRAIALLTLALPQSASAQQTDGERLFRQRCASCHSLETDVRSAGPSLAGVIGRKAGSLKDTRYSRALQDSGLTWDADTLDRFLSDPNEVVPGTSMRIRVTYPEQREAIIEFLDGA